MRSSNRKRSTISNPMDELKQAFQGRWTQEDFDKVQSILDRQAEKNNNKTTEITESGKKILLYLQGATPTPPEEGFSSRAIGDALFLAPRSVSGTMRKLVDDGYVTKQGSNPVLYNLTQKGIDYKEVIEEEEENN